MAKKLELQSQTLKIEQLDLNYRGKNIKSCSITYVINYK